MEKHFFDFMNTPKLYNIAYILSSHDVGSSGYHLLLAPRIQYPHGFSYTNFCSQPCQ